MMTELLDVRQGIAELLADTSWYGVEELRMLSAAYLMLTGGWRCGFEAICQEVKRGVTEMQVPLKVQVQGAYFDVLFKSPWADGTQWEIISSLSIGHLDEWDRVIATVHSFCVGYQSGRRRQMMGFEDF